uniref:DDE-1 domain-containing protein n=1 Tax=Trichogramma kaykai TaxID=54128 RepID=A0ABD2VTW3_9HYME
MRRLGVQGLIFFLLGEPPILHDAIVDCRIPFFRAVCCVVTHCWHLLLNNRPGTEWFKAFLGHHKKLFECIGQNLTTTRCSVTEEDLRGWFKHVSESLKTKNLLKIDASRVFNLDESAFALVPKDNNVITKKGASNNFSSDGKKSLTILFTVCEDGRMLHLSRFLLAGQLAIQNLGG